MLHLRELQVLCRICVVERDREVVENWLIAKTTFPSPGCGMSHTHPEVMREQQVAVKGVELSWHEFALVKSAEELWCRSNDT